MMTLSEWMAANGKDDASLAADLELDRTSVSRLRRGKQLPSAATIAKIADITEGQVLPNSFFGFPASTEAA